MKRRAFLKNTNGKVLLWALAFSFTLALWLYLLLFQSPLLSRREYFFALLLWLALTPLTYLLLEHFLLPRLQEYTPRARCNWVLLSIGVGILFALVARAPQTILLLPNHTLQVVIPAGEAGRTINLEYAKTALRDLSFNELNLKGDWQRTEGGLTYTGEEPALIIWRGRTGDSAKLIFTDSPDLQALEVSWDGKIIPTDSLKTGAGQVSIDHTFPAGLLAGITGRIILGFTIGFLFLVLTLFLANVQLKAAQPEKRKRRYWLLYALPMIVVWGIYLLTFFPGLMSSDSYDQWSQVVSMHFNDWHPVFHTLLLWLITRIWLSPAAVVVFQILALSLTVAWGIGLLCQYGLPRWGAWLIAGIFALSPINGQLTITMWKDIPYSTSMLLFSLLTLKIVFTQGEWLGRRMVWIALGLVGAFIALFRHNGLPIPFFGFLALGLVYRKHWKSVIKSFSLFVVIYLLVQYPLYTLLNVDRSLGTKQQVFVHHIAAHMVHGGPLTPSEQKLAQLIVPEGNWQYDCCSAVPTYASPGFSDERNGQNAAQIQTLFIKLFLKEPLVEINHQVCVTSLIWEIPSRCMSVLFFPYDLSMFEKSSLLPGLIPTISPILAAMRDSEDVNTFVSPAIYLIFGLYSTLLFALRKRNARFNLFMLPAVVNSLVLLVVNLSVNFRYQYGVYLVGLFSIGLLILALYAPKLSQPGKE